MWACWIGIAIGLLSAIHSIILRALATSIADRVEHGCADVTVREHVLLHHSALRSGYHGTCSSTSESRDPKVALIPLLQLAVSQILHLLLPQDLLLLGRAAGVHLARGRSQLGAPDGLVLHLRRLHLVQRLLLERRLLQDLRLLLVLVIVSSLALRRARGLLPCLSWACSQMVVGTRIILHDVGDQESLILAADSRLQGLSLELSSYLLVGSQVLRRLR